MIYFKDENNKIYAYNDDVNEAYIKPNLTSITETEKQSFKLFGVFDKTQEEIDSFLEQQKIEREIKAQRIAFNNAIQTHLDSKAKEFRYDNMMSARSYAGYENVFQEEATKLAQWASNCWITAGTIEQDVLNGNREMPSIDEVLAELPIYE